MAIREKCNSSCYLLGKKERDRPHRRLSPSLITIKKEGYFLGKTFQ
jgi:hypothetical protein